jgi:cytochrome P450
MSDQRGKASPNVKEGTVMIDVITDSCNPRSPAQDGLETPFDLNDLRSNGLLARIIERLFDDPQWLFGLLRDFLPIPHLPFTNWWMVTRYDDVQEVLGQDDIFPVPFGPKVMELNGGPNFLLGMSANNDYWRYHRQVMQAFRLDDVTDIVAPKSFEFANAIIEESSGRLDAVQDLITRVPTMLCQVYYGIAIGAPEQMLAFG